MGRAKCVLGPSGGDSEWKVFRTWDVDLSDLIPLPDEASVFSICSVVYLQHSFLRTAGSVIPVNCRRTHCSSSSLTPGLHFTYPTGLLGASPEGSLPQSPDYNSDTEVTTLHSRKPIPSPFFIPPRRRTFKKDLTTSNYQDLVK